MSKVTDLQNERCDLIEDKLETDAIRVKGSTLKMIEHRIGLTNYGKIESLIYGLMKCAELQGELNYKKKLREQRKMSYKKDIKISETNLEVKTQIMNNKESNKEIMNKWENGEITHVKAVALYNELNGTSINRQQFVVEARKYGFSKSLRKMKEKGEISW